MGVAFDPGLPVRAGAGGRVEERRVGVLSGPFKIVLQALERSSSPDTLGDPTAARVRSELARMFQLDEETASNIVSAMPIVILDGLDVRTAGVVRDRLQGMRDAGCRVVVTDEVTDTIPRVNWPQLPPIARVEPSSDSGREARGAIAAPQVGHMPPHEAGLACPHCGGGLQLVASGATPRGGPPGGGRAVSEREPEPEPALVTREREARERPREPARSSRADEEDWLSPPVGSGAVPAGALGGAPPSTTARRPSGRFDDAALLAYRRADPVDDARSLDPAPAVVPAPTSLGTATSEILEVSFSDSGELEPALAEQARRGPPTPAARVAAAPEREASRGRATSSTFDDLDEPLGRGGSSAFDDLDEPRGRSAAAAAFDDDVEPSLLDSDDGFGEPPSRSRSSSSTAASRRPEPQRAPERSASHSRSRSADPFEDSLAGLDAPAPAASSSSRADRSADPFASQPPARDAASSPSRPGYGGRASQTSDPFEDSRVLDDLSGLSGISAQDLESGAGRDPLEDSGSDILDEPPPHRRKDASSPNRFKSDLDIFDGGADLGASDELPPPPPPAGRRGASSGSRDLLDDDDALQLLDSDDQGPAPPPPSKRKGSSRGGRGAPDLDDVLNMFGPEDDAPLDDGSGLEPAPLDLSPPGAAGRPAAKARGGERGFDADLSDILEPLDPGEALEIIKTSKPGRGRPSGAAAAANGRHDEPSGLEQLDLSEAGAMLAEAKQDRRSAKKSRGVPFPASDEDVGLFEESSRSGRPNKKKTDPFARARGRMQEEEERDRRSGADRSGADRSGSDRAGADRAERDRGDRGRAEAKETAASDRPRADARGAKRPAGPAPTGDGDHGLVLSRIADPDKKEQAAEIIAEVKGCSLDDARRLTDRTIIPVLKGVSREVAEFHLEKFKRVKIAGRVTTRQRG